MRLIPFLAWFCIAALTLLAPGCATSTSTYRSASLQITDVPTTYSEELASIGAQKVADTVNRAFIDDGRFKVGGGLRLTIEITRFDPPRRAGTQTYSEIPGTNYRFLPGIMVVTVRFFDEKGTAINQVEFAQDIMPRPGDISNYAAINEAVGELASRIRVYTIHHYLLL
jgi:hypothetical protein